MSSHKNQGKGGEFARGFFTPFVLDRVMRRVLHVGPCDTPGGMATVMQTLAEFPPEGWQADLLASHAPGGLWAKWRAYRRARCELIRRCRSSTERPNLVHVHTASDWSWRRKARLVRVSQRYNIPVVVHIHSGGFSDWLGKPSSRRCRRVRSLLDHPGVNGVTLHKAWSDHLRDQLGDLLHVENPVVVVGKGVSIDRDSHHLLLMGRLDPVKGHDFAIKVGELLRMDFPDLQMTVTGLETSSHKWVHAKGWVEEEEKRELFEKASLLLIPSAYEGQPMVMLEALAHGLPVCVSDRLIGLPQHVGVARYGDLDHWVVTVKTIIRNPPSQTNLEDAVRPFSIVHLQPKWGEIYDAS